MKRTMISYPVRLLAVLASLLTAVSVFLPEPAEAAPFGPIKQFKVRQLTATTTGQSIKTLDTLPTIGGSAYPSSFDCSVLIVNTSASTNLLVGGPDNQALGDGGPYTARYISVGLASANTISQLKVDGDPGQIFVRVSSGTLAFTVLLGGNCQ